MAGRLPPGARRRLLVRLSAALALAAGLLALLLLARSHPGELPLSPRCSFLMLTGLRCPGCGLTRATHEVLQGRFAEAVHLNPLVLGLPLLGGWLGWLIGHALARGELPRMPSPHPAVGWALAALLGGLWAVRLVQDLWAG